MTDDTVNIIVIGYGLPEMEKACLNSIIDVTSHPYILTYLDNKKINQSLTKSWNIEIRHSSCPLICLINSDTIVYKGWIEKMVETLLSDEKIGFVGPSTNNCHSPQKTIPTFEEAQKHSEQTQIMGQPISGFALTFRRSLWEELGGFDERFALYGQESLFQFKAQRLGYQCVWRKDAFVFHHGEMSIKASGLDVNKERAIAKKLYWEEVRKIKGTKS